MPADRTTAPEGEDARCEITLGEARKVQAEFTKLNGLPVSSAMVVEVMAAAIRSGLLARPADRQGDAAGIVGEAIAVARAAQGPHTVAPTPPAPLGLVDAVRTAFENRVTVMIEDDGYKKPKVVIPFRTGQEAEAAMDALEAFLALDATLSGQQGGAVPAEVTAQELLDAMNAKPGVSWVATIKDVQDVLWELRRARLAEQPAPAERSKEWWLDRARREDGCESVQAGDPAEQPAPARTGEVERVEGLRPPAHYFRSGKEAGLRMALNIVQTARHNSESPDESIRTTKISNALHTALAALAATATDGAPRDGEG